MPRRKDAVNVGLQFTPDQHAALIKASVAANLTLSAYIRKVLAGNVPGFVDTLEKRERRAKG